VSRKNYGKRRQDQYAYQQAAILQEHFHRFFRGKGLDEGNEENRCSYLQSFMFGSALSNFLKSEVIKKWLNPSPKKHCTITSGGTSKKFPGA
jgi:hypothetical protein